MKKRFLKSLSYRLWWLARRFDDAHEWLNDRIYTKSTNQQAEQAVMSPQVTAFLQEKNRAHVERSAALKAFADELREKHSGDFVRFVRPPIFEEKE